MTIRSSRYEAKHGSLELRSHGYASSACLVLPLPNTERRQSQREQAAASRRVISMKSERASVMRDRAAQLEPDA
jgi:hypothetical protein